MSDERDDERTGERPDEESDDDRSTIHRMVDSAREEIREFARGREESPEDEDAGRADQDDGASAPDAPADDGPDGEERSGGAEIDDADPAEREPSAAHDEADGRAASSEQPSGQDGFEWVDESEMDDGGAGEELSVGSGGDDGGEPDGTTAEDDHSDDAGGTGGQEPDSPEPVRLDLRGPPEDPAAGEEVTFTVTDDEGTPVEGATLETTTGERVRTGDEGTVTLAFEEAGRVAVTVDVHDHERSVVGDRAEFEVRQRTPLSIAADETACPVGDPVGFTVRDDEGEPVEGAVVAGGDASGTTDEEGRSELVFEQPGETTVRARKEADDVAYEPATATVSVVSRAEYIDRLAARLEELEAELERGDERLVATREALAERRAEYIDHLEGRVEELARERDDLQQRIEFLESSHEQELRRTVADLAEQLVYGVREDMASALDHDEEAKLREAVEQSIDEFDDVLEHQADVRLVRPSPGDELDREYHHPIATKAEEGDAGEIVEVVQPGIVLDGTVVEKAKVTVGDD